jgi:RNA polymerase sigma-70 factor (ECF subfamily)
VSLDTVMAKRLGDDDSASGTAFADPLAEFHSGSKAALEACYREHFAAVDRAVARILTGADRETAVHEVFFRVISNAPLRQSYQGGSLGAWLAAIARNHAIDFARRRQREQPAGGESEWIDEREQPDADALERRTQAGALIERFRAEHLPAKWAAVFELRFLEHLDQRQAAAKLGVHRTTLAYREYRVRALLQRFLLKTERA